MNDRGNLSGQKKKTLHKKSRDHTDCHSHKGASGKEGMFFSLSPSKKMPLKKANQIPQQPDRVAGDLRISQQLIQKKSEYEGSKQFHSVH